MEHICVQPSETFESLRLVAVGLDRRSIDLHVRRYPQSYLSTLHVNCIITNVYVEVHSNCMLAVHLGRLNKGGGVGSVW